MRRTSRGIGVSAVAALTLSLVLCSCGGASNAGRTGTTTRAHGRSVSFDGATLSHPLPEPPLVLRDFRGHRVDISSYRGKAVLVTFLYTHCPDTCPLITANLHNALALLGPQAPKVQVIGVSTDPKGDTPAAVATFLAKHEMTGRMEYLIGSRAALAPTWRAWDVTATNPSAADRVGHSALVYGISASGRLMTAYAANFTPSEIAHDVPRLASL